MGHRLGIVLVIAMLACAAPVFARPPHKKALADHMGPFLSSTLNDCRTCHLPDDPAKPVDPLAADEKPHNPFGARVKAIKKDLQKDGRKSDIPARVDAIANEDSDGDGVPNLVELLTGHFAGDAADKPTQEEVAEARRTLLAFEKHKLAHPWRPFDIVVRPTPPAVTATSWSRNPIDAFVAAEHEARGLKPRPEAAKEVLLRRVYLDLTGLPPKPSELHAFLTDESPNAYEKVVERLLASPRYGERWGRHWMDVWRYSDWAGFGQEVRDSQPHMWRWRDWIVESLNKDKGYDRMVMEMLAADELTPDDGDALRATGYLVRNYKRYSRERWLQDVVDHTGQAFLGVTLGCARCHDHMFDPILQKEYYQVRAIFEPHNIRTDRLPGQADLMKDGLARAFDATLDAKTFLLIRGDERTPEKTPLVPGVPEALGGKFPPVEAVKLPAEAYMPEKRDYIVKETIAAGAGEVTNARNALGAAQKNASDNLWQAVHLPALYAKTRYELRLAELNAPLADARQWALITSLRAEKLEESGKRDTEDWTIAATAATEAQRKAAVLEGRRDILMAQWSVRTGPMAMKAAATKKLTDATNALAKAEVDVQLPPTTAFARKSVKAYPSTSTGRRLAFARWIADRENPLTARVAVNHIWLRHFGQALVPSVFDFGRSGRPPSHPALLDWLAAEFMDPSTQPSPRKGEGAGGWSMKHLHRLILTSRTYRQASTPDPECATKDPDNNYYWRMSPRRLEAEAVRDSVYFVSGKLDLTMGGPEIDHAAGLTNPRRSIYFRHAQEKQMEFLKIFDVASVTECYSRNESVMPQQALALANSELTLRSSRILALALTKKSGSDAKAFIESAFEQVLSRSPSDAEHAECLAFLKERTQTYAKEGPKSLDGPETDGKAPANHPALRARENLVHVLFNHHEFVTIR